MLPAEEMAAEDLCQRVGTATVRLDRELDVHYITVEYIGGNINGTPLRLVAERLYVKCKTLSLM